MNDNTSGIIPPPGSIEREAREEWNRKWDRISEVVTMTALFGGMGFALLYAMLKLLWWLPHAPY